MKNNYMLIITGAPATGKTTYGRKISQNLGIPFISKDKLKETIYDAITQNTLLEYEEKRRIGSISYSILFLIAEELMMVGNSFIIESNFGKESISTIEKLALKYEYNTLTIRFECDLEVLHKRFLARENMQERHPGLRSNGIFDEQNAFKKAVNMSKEFKLDDKEIIIDTTDFNKVDLEFLINSIKKRLI